MYTKLISILLLLAAVLACIGVSYVSAEPGYRRHYGGYGHGGGYSHGHGHGHGGYGGHGGGHGGYGGYGHHGGYGYGR